jgi:hypothetical protein
MKHTLFTIALLISSVLSGCTSSKPITTENGKVGYSINCSEGNISHCYEKAGDKCGGKGFNILHSSNIRDGFFTGADKTLIVECK